MKKLLLIFLLLPCTVQAQDLHIEIISFSRNSSGSKYLWGTRAVVRLTNNSGKYLDYCWVTTTLLNNQKTVTIQSRAFTGIQSGGFHSKAFIFEYSGEANEYKISVTNIVYGD